MKLPFKTRVIPAVLAGVLAGSLAWADDAPETDVTDAQAVESVSSMPSKDIASVFADFFGDEGSSQATVEGLRNGTITYQPPVDETADTTGDETGTDQTATDETGTEQETADIEEAGGEDSDAGKGMGYGNVYITLALAEQLSKASAAEALEGETGMTADESLNEILYMRQEQGMGWGQIAKELGFNLGEVMSGLHSNRPEKADMAKAQKEGRGSQSMRPDHASMEKPEKVAKMDRPEHPMKMERAERPEKPVRPEKPARPERPGH